MKHRILLILASTLFTAFTLTTKAQHQKGTRSATRYLNAAPPSDLDNPRPITARDTLFIEEMTWMEVRDAQRDGKNSIIIATGGIEQNGPYVALGKHNYVLRQDCEAIARKLGNALIAPIVPFVPEGEHNPTTHHMRYPGTISISENTFEALLIDIATSFKVHHFKHIFLLGDSGDNQFGMQKVASKLAEEWKDHPTRIFFIPEYYAPQAITDWLGARGIKEVDEGLHDRFRYEAQIATLDPDHIRYEERLKVGLTSINGISLLPFEKTLELGKQLTQFQAKRTVAAIHARTK